MDRPTVYRGELPYETDFLGGIRWAYEGFGLLALDIIGATTQVAGFACTPTSPTSLAVIVNAGRIYKLMNLDDTPQGQLFGVGGLPADTDPDHKVVKQGLMRDPVTLATPAPASVGFSQIYLVQARFVESDAAATALFFYNSSNPTAPTQQNLSNARYNLAEVSIKAGIAATTGTQVAPTADAGWVPMWAIVVANGATAVVGGNITVASGAPFVNIGSGGGGGTGLTPWQVITANYTAVIGDRLILDSTAGAFTVTLPATPSAGGDVWLKSRGLTNNVTVGRNGKKIAGFTSDLVLNKDHITTILAYDSATADWWV